MLIFRSNFSSIFFVIIKYLEDISQRRVVFFYIKERDMVKYSFIGIFNRYIIDFFLFFILGLDKIEFLQSYENQEIYQKVFDFIEYYFGIEDEDSSIVFQVDFSQQQYIFQQCEVFMEGFQF